MAKTGVTKKFSKRPKMVFPNRIFSGNYSGDMWDEINSARTVSDLRDALYLVCCRLQELEFKLSGDQDSHG